MVDHTRAQDALRSGERDKSAMFGQLKDVEDKIKAFDAELVSVDAEAEDAKRQADEKVKVLDVAQTRYIERMAFRPVL